MQGHVFRTNGEVSWVLHERQTPFLLSLEFSKAGTYHALLQQKF